MTLPEEVLQKLTKNELVNHVFRLSRLKKFNLTLANTDKDMYELRKDFEKLDFAISRSANAKLSDRIISL